MIEPTQSINEAQNQAQGIEVSEQEIRSKQEHLKAKGYSDFYDPEAHRQLAEHYLKMRRGDTHGFALLGNVGTGKTLFCTQFLRTRLITAIQIVELYNEIGFNDAFRQRVHGVYRDANVEKGPHSLVIDDLGAEPVGKRYGETREVLADVIAERYAYWHKYEVRTFITANLTGQQIDERYGRRISDRIGELCTVIYFTGKSARTG